jgi:hypothetical protein
MTLDLRTVSLPWNTPSRPDQVSSRTRWRFRRVSGKAAAADLTNTTGRHRQDEYCDRAQIRQLCASPRVTVDSLFAAPIGGTACVIRGSIGRSTCSQQLTGPLSWRACDLETVRALVPHLAGVAAERVRSRQVGACADRACVSEAACTRCGVVSRQVRSRYRRQLADTASGGREVLIDLQSRRFCRKNDPCARATFAEQVPGLLPGTAVGPAGGAGRGRAGPGRPGRRPADGQAVLRSEPRRMLCRGRCCGHAAAHPGRRPVAQPGRSRRACRRPAPLLPAKTAVGPEPGPAAEQAATAPEAGLGARTRARRAEVHAAPACGLIIHRDQPHFYGWTARQPAVTPTATTADELIPASACPVPAGPARPASRLAAAVVGRRARSTELLYQELRGRGYQGSLRTLQRLTTQLHRDTAISRRPVSAQSQGGG